MDTKLARFLLAAVLAAVALLAPTSALAAATVSQGTTETSISTSIYVPCANGGTGEYVDITGTMKSTFRLVLDDSGGYHQSERYSYKGTGTGRTTGTEYRFSGEDNYKFAGIAGVMETYVWSWRVTSPGGASNFMMRGNYHVLISPDGVVTAFHDNLTADCK